MLHKKKKSIDNQTSKAETTLELHSLCDPLKDFNQVALSISKFNLSFRLPKIHKLPT